MTTSNTSVTDATCPDLTEESPTITRQDIIGNHRLVRLALSCADTSSIRGLAALSGIILLPLIILSAVSVAEGRFLPGSVTAPLEHPQATEVLGMSFVGDTMVWPFCVLIPFACVFLNIAVGRTCRFLQELPSMLSADWIAGNAREYRHLIEDAKTDLNGGNIWRWIYGMCLLAGMGMFAWNAVTCTFPEQFRPYTGTSVNTIQANAIVLERFDSAIRLPKWDTDWRSAPGCWAAARIWVLIVGYFWLPLILYKLFNLVGSTYRLLRRLSHRTGALNVRPLAPDRAGGLSHVGAMALSFVYPMTVFGIMMTMPFLKENTPPSVHNWIVLLPFVPLFFVVFFVPLIGVHGAMEGAKEHCLRDISDLFDRVNANFMAELRSPTLDVDGFNRLEASLRGLRDCHERVERMPVWPFDLGLIHRLLAGVLIPLAIPILQLVVERFAD